MDEIWKLVVLAVAKLVINSGTTHIHFALYMPAN